MDLVLPSKGLDMADMDPKPSNKAFSTTITFPLRLTVTKQYIIQLPTLLILAL